MSRVEPGDIRAVPNHEEVESYYEDRMGYVPNSVGLLAHHPAILRAFMELARATEAGGGEVDPVLKRKVAFLASQTRGCTFCQTHSAYGLSRSNVRDDEIAAIWDFETDSWFDDRERAALRLARDSALQPNAVTDAHFEELKKYFSDEQVMELVATCALRAWLNVFNQTLATTLEPVPVEWMTRAGIVEIEPMHLP